MQRRAEDFRRFMGSLRTLAESMDMVPELPEGVGVYYLERVLAEFPVAEDPYEPSGILEGGLKIWDSMYLPYPKCASLEPKRVKDLSALRSVNAEWEKTKEALGMVGRPDGVHYLRPKGPYIMDMMNDDIRMLQGAHVLAHRAAQVQEGDDYTFGQTSDVFLRSLVKLFLARKYGLMMNMHPETDAEDSFSLYGIEVFGSADLRSPTLLAAAGRTSRLKPNRTVALVLGSVGIEAHPRQAAEGTEWREINKWSCLPTLVALAGWECVDYVAHAERVELAGETHYAVPCGDLQPMSSFSELLAAARERRMEPESREGVFRVEDWLRSGDFERGLSVTPQLPCPHCIRLNDSADGVVRRPRSRRPRMALKDAKSSTAPEVKEWCGYAQFMRNCIAIGRRATAYALGSVTSVANRNSAFRKRSRILKRLSAMEARRRRKASGGFIAEAKRLDADIEKLRKELE